MARDPCERGGKIAEQVTPFSVPELLARAPRHRNLGLTHPGRSGHCPDHAAVPVAIPPQPCTCKSARWRGCCNRGERYPALVRTFYLVYRTDELGVVAQDIVTLVRVAAHDRQRKMMAGLKLPPGLMLTDAFANP